MPMTLPFIVVATAIVFALNTLYGRVVDGSLFYGVLRGSIAAVLFYAAMLTIAFIRKG